MATATAKVEVLTAEVRVLQVGNRQVTMSVYRQLDEVGYRDIFPFGRVRDRTDERYGEICVVGKHRHDGSLVRSRSRMPEVRGRVGVRDLYCRCRLDSSGGWPNCMGWDLVIDRPEAGCPEDCDGSSDTVETIDEVMVHDLWSSSRDELLDRVASFEAEFLWLRDWENLPLIVLAGLR